MTNVKFLQGLKANLPTSAEEGTLLFTTDSGEIFKGNGISSPLTPVSNVLYGYENLADLQLKNPKIKDKIYLTNDGKMYSYNTTTLEYYPVGGANSSNDIDFNKDGSTITADTVEGAIKEVDAKFTASKGKVQIDTSDTEDYLGQKLHSTLVVDAGKIKVVNVDGLTVGITDINNYLTGTTGNIQGQLDVLKTTISDMSTGLNYIGMFDTLVALNAHPSPLNGDVAVVTNSSLGEASELYVYSLTSTAWQLLGKFEFSETFIGLKDTPSNYTNSTGKVLKSNGSGLVFGDVSYEDLVGKPNVSTVDIEDAVGKKHEHSNSVTLEKLGEDAEGNLTFNGSAVAPQWGTFNI